MALTALLFLLATGIAQARPAVRVELPGVSLPPGAAMEMLATPGSPTALSRLITTGAVETTYFGGTVWAADSNRYEALPGGTWTFDSGEGSSLVPPGYACKPAGYHRTFEGWTEVTQADKAAVDFWRRTTTCAIGGGASMWLGKTVAEAGALCYAAGAGYGHNWDYYVGKTFQYPGSGTITLSFDYAVDAEPTFDYLHVKVDTSGTAPAPAALVLLHSSTGSTSGHAVLTLQPGVSLPAHAGPVRILFHGTSDAGYDDEDGSYATTCGLAAIDNVTLTGAVTDAATFETGDNGWAPVTFCGDGQWADLAHLSSLGPLPDCTINLGTCAMSDSVLLFHQPGLNWFYDPLSDIVLSPWINLRRAGVTSLAGCFLEFDGYFNLRASSYAYTRFLVQWTPGPCAGSGGTSSALITLPSAYWGGFQPRCLANGQPERIDLSPYVPADARDVRVGIGFFANCGLCDPDPEAAAWFDNVRFGVVDRSAPTLTSPVHAPAWARDAFASDGTLNPGSVARMDGRGDTLTCTAAGTNVEVRVNFRVRPGPFMDTVSLNAWAAGTWTAAPSIGPDWWTARMDSAESNGPPVASTWMTTLHESDPKFGAGTDRDHGGDGDTGLSHDIFPDHLLTPGARVDYFYSARYPPPDPRNPTGDSWSVLPDTTGGHFLEMEVLPSSMSTDTTWNCVLYVNGHAADEDTKRLLEEVGLNQSLGAGGLNDEETRFDRVDLRDPSGVRLKATSAQLGAYGTILWSLGESADIYRSIPIGNTDAVHITDWLSSATPAQPRRFWYSGSWAVSALVRGTSAQQTLARNLLGVDAPLYDEDMPGTCSALSPVAGAHFSVPGAAACRKPACDRMLADRLVVHASATTTARGQLELSTGQPISISNDVPTAGRSTLVDAFPLYSLRAAGGGCDNPAAITQRVVSALAWFGLPNGGSCTPGGVSEVPPVPGSSPGGVLSLDTVYRRAGEEAWRVGFSLPAPVPVTLRVFDVSGRQLATPIQSQLLAAGRHEVLWDGRGAGGQRVSAGLYFVRLAAPTGSRTMKIVVTAR